MEAIENLIMGDPVYDCKGRVVRRNFGIKNIVIILAIVYGLYSLRGKMAIKSGRRKLRGGSLKGESDTGSQGSEDTNTSSNRSGRKSTSQEREVEPWWWGVLLVSCICGSVLALVGLVMIGNEKHWFDEQH